LERLWYEKAGALLEPAEKFAVRGSRGTHPN
jgi:hypothetical protein